MVAERKSSMSLELFCLKYAETFLPKSMIFDNDGDSVKLPITLAIYLIKTGDRNILVDAGCDTMPGFIMKKRYSPAFVVRCADVSPDDITDVIITHSHHDHIEALSHFRNASVCITKNEFENGKFYIPKDLKVNLFDGEFLLTPQIKIIEIGGHSKGSAIVEIKADDITHVLVGDECYTNANIDKKICTGVYTNHEKTMAFIEKYSSKKYLVHTCHDNSLKTERII